MGKKFLWAFFLFSACSIYDAMIALAADPPVINTSKTDTFVPTQNTNVNTNPTSSSSTPTKVNVPTPDTIPAPSVTQTPPSLGQFRNQRNEVNIGKLFLERYKESVVRVSAKDLAGNVLAESMGVGVGRNAQYIAAPLSIILGNSQQWADRIEITHAEGNKYSAQISFIDEERNLVLLAPEANPAPIPFVDPSNERPQIDVFTISFKPSAEEGIEAKIHRSKLAAVSPETGVLSVSGKEISNDQSGSAIINAQGELVGMLLPDGRGVLASTLTKLVYKAQKSKPIAPSLIGAILGRGVLIDAKITGAFKTITSALEAIKKGEAPKADPTRYTPARDRALAPKESDKIVIKVMPGVYKEEKTISIPNHISLSGSGANNTHIIGNDPNKPVLLIQNANNVQISGFRITPAPLQSMKAPAVIISKSTGVTMLGNVLEAKGGVAIWSNESRNTNIYGNSFARGQSRAISCDRSSMDIQANSFVGDWPFAISADKNCDAKIFRNLFFENKVAINSSNLVSSLKMIQNTFIRIPSAIKLATSAFTLQENLFFECPQAVYSFIDMKLNRSDRNALWKSKISFRGKQAALTTIVRTEPKFEAPENFDFRIKAGSAQSGYGSEDSDLGAFQRSDWLGTYTHQFTHTLGVVLGNKDLAQIWGIQP